MISLKAVWRAGAPVVVVETADAKQTIDSIIAERRAFKGSNVAILRHDVCRGLVALSKEGQEALEFILPEGVDAKMATQNATEALQFLMRLPIPEEDVDGEKQPRYRRALVFMMNAQRYWNEPSGAQAIWNLRDTLKAMGATLVLLCPNAGGMPDELKNDVVVLTDSLPTVEEVRSIADSVLKDAGVKSPSADEKERILDTMLGLSAFSAEQALAMSITKDGVDRTQLWQRKAKTVEQTDGLSVYRGKERFSDIGGLANAKDILSKTIAGKTAVRAIVFLDEIDKAFAAARSDSSGVTQDQNKVLLTYMQDNDILGMLLLGPPGTGKTVLCKAAANEHEILLIQLDLGAMMSKYVGDSQGAVRTGIQVIHAITGGKALFVGACNRTDTLPPELRRRFNYCSLFVDLPDAAEREAMWKIWMAKYSLKSQPKPDDNNWTGAEIRNCCLKAWAMNCSLKEAAMSIVPVAVSAAEEVQGLRKSANAKFISASKAGLFRFDAPPAEAKAGRRFES